MDSKNWLVTSGLCSAIERKLVSGQTLFSQGQHSACLYEVVSGKIRLSCVHTAGREVVLGFASEGNTIGEARPCSHRSTTATPSQRHPQLFVFAKKPPYWPSLRAIRKLHKHSWRAFPAGSSIYELVWRGTAFTRHAAACLTDANLMSQSPLDRGLNEARLVILTCRLLRFSCAHRHSRPPILRDCDQAVP
jgi:hypothetical protein